MLSHVVCQPTKPDGGEKVDAEAHVARSVLQACVRTPLRTMQQCRHCMQTATQSAVKKVNKGAALMFQVTDKECIQLQSTGTCCLGHFQVVSSEYHHCQLNNS